MIPPSSRFWDSESEKWKRRAGASQPSAQRRPSPAAVTHSPLLPRAPADPGSHPGSQRGSVGLSGAAGLGAQDRFWGDTHEPRRMQALHRHRTKRQMLVNVAVKTICCRQHTARDISDFIFLFIHSTCKHTRVVLVSEASLAISFLLSSTCINGKLWGCSSLF